MVTSTKCAWCGEALSVKQYYETRFHPRCAKEREKRIEIEKNMTPEEIFSKYGNKICSECGGLIDIKGKTLTAQKRTIKHKECANRKLTDWQKLDKYKGITCECCGNQIDILGQKEFVANKLKYCDDCRPQMTKTKKKRTKEEWEELYKTKKCKQCGKRIETKGLSHNALSRKEYCTECAKERIKRSKKMQLELRKLDFMWEDNLVERETVEERTIRVKSKVFKSQEEKMQETIEKYARIDLSKYKEIIGEKHV